VCVLTAEVGDYCEEFAEQEYMSNMKLLPNQTRRIELQIMQHHKEHVYVLWVICYSFDVVVVAAVGLQDEMYMNLIYVNLLLFIAYLFRSSMSVASVMFCNCRSFAVCTILKLLQNLYSAQIQPTLQSWS